MVRLARLAESLLTPHGFDRYVELLDPMLVRRDIRGQITSVRRQTSGTVTLTVRPSRAFRGFVAGQFVRVSVEIDGVWWTRCYSPASSQHRGPEFELTIKAHDDGFVSRYLVAHADVGMMLGLSQAEGVFTVPSPRPERLVLISGGSGITPVLAMARTLVDERHRGEVAFLYYARSEADVPYAAELAELGAQEGFSVSIRHTSVDGHFDVAHLEHVAPWFRDAPTFLCGPTALMDAVRHAYEGFSEHLHTECFTPPTPIVDGEATGRLSFTRSGVTVDNDGRTLLEQAEAAGLTPEHGCRMGICFSCTQRKVSGVVRGASGGTSGEDDEEIQLCVSVPVGDVRIDC